jgi:hypothetical protein
MSGNTDIGARLGTDLAIPTLEVFKGLVHTMTAVANTGGAILIPASPLANRKGLIIQNVDSSKVVYIGGCVPQAMTSPTGIGSLRYPINREAKEQKIKWLLSSGGTNEWYAVDQDLGDPGLTAAVSGASCLYSATIGNAETKRTNGTVGALASANDWGWGNGDTLGYDTLYIRTAGSTIAYSPDRVYEMILLYSQLPDTSSTYGYRLGPYDAIWLTLDGSAKVFAVASADSANLITLEVI